jgi:hypothetical protein
MIDGRVIDHAMAQQRPILHQAQHGVPPAAALSALVALAARF